MNSGFGFNIGFTCFLKKKTN